MNAPIDPVVDVYLGPDDLHRALAADAESGLLASPKDLPPKWFYDQRGSELFDQITRLDEYYPTEAEREALLREAATIIGEAAADTIVELGSGTSDKTTALLDEAVAQGTIERFIPFDVSESFLVESARTLAGRYPGLAIHGVVGDFDHHLAKIPSGGRRLVVMLGGTIGNYQPRPRRDLLEDIVAGMEPGDHLLLGADLVKDVDRLELAYDDSHGLTAAFNTNVLAVINRELAADFDLGRFEHVARFDPYHEWIEMFLRSTADQTVMIGELGLAVPFRRGELLRTEVSAKFRQGRLEAELEAVGLEPARWWTDERGDFGLSLSIRTADAVIRH
jgi:L-histidine N-alpha-methyltransferase